MTENRENVQQAVPAAWESVLAQMSEEFAAKEAAAQVQEMRAMTAFVEARTAPCYRLRLEHARRKIADRGAKQVKALRRAFQFDAMERALEATIVYMKILNVLEKPEVQSELTEEEFARLVDQLTQECLFVIENPDIWPE